MIQRVQSIHLLLASVCGFLMIKLPIFEAALLAGGSSGFLANESLPVFAMAMAAALLALVTIFLFRNRPLQSKLSLLGVLLAIGLTALVVWLFGTFGKTPDVAKTSYSWGALLPIAMTIFFFLAWLNIRKDEKLIKSLDRLR